MKIKSLIRSLKLFPQNIDVLICSPNGNMAHSIDLLRIDESNGETKLILESFSNVNDDEINGEWTAYIKCISNGKSKE